MGTMLKTLVVVFGLGLVGCGMEEGPTGEPSSEEAQQSVASEDEAPFLGGNYCQVHSISGVWQETGVCVKPVQPGHCQLTTSANCVAGKGAVGTVTLACGYYHDSQACN